MEFENLQIEVPTGDNNSSYLGVKVFEKKYHNKDKGFVVGFDPYSKESIERKQRRAKRFGGKQKEKITAEKTDRMSDTERFGLIDFKTLQWPPIPYEANEEIRSDAILLYGVDHMSTTDVFEYFQLFGPEAIEWIDDCSCNVVWDDKAVVMKALDTLSKTYGKLLELQRKVSETPRPVPTEPVVPVIIKEEDEDEEILSYENQVVVEDDPEIDPKDIWRVGLPYRENQLFLRYATVKDRKLPGAAKRSEYYLKYGRNPENTKNGVQGILTNSRKRKLQDMKKLAESRFKSNEPDVKIVSLAELKSEGIITKMEVDEEEEEPVVKRLNVDGRENISMTMVADKVEVQQRLGDRYQGDTVHDRLGTPLPEDDRNTRSERVQDRLGDRFDGLGRRINNSQLDARDDIDSTRRTHNNQTYLSGDSYIDDYGDYHDIYRARDVKNEEEDDDYKVDKEEIDRQISNHHGMYDSDEDTGSPRGIQHRLGPSRERAPVSDLRDKLRRKEKNRQQAPVIEESSINEALNDDIKDEIDGEKLNLCIEIKQEPQQETAEELPELPMEDEESEFEF